MRREHYIRQPQPEDDSGAYLGIRPHRSLGIKTGHNLAGSMVKDSFDHEKRRVELGTVSRRRALKELLT